MAGLAITMQAWPLQSLSKMILVLLVLIVICELL